MMGDYVVRVLIMYGSHGSSLCKHLLHLRFLLAASEQASRECEDQVANLKQDRELLTHQINNLRVREKSGLVEQTQRETEAVRSTFDAICLKKESLNNHVERLRQQINQEQQVRTQQQQELQRLQEKIDQSRRDQLTEQFREEETRKEIELLQRELKAFRAGNKIKETRITFEEVKCLQWQNSINRAERQKSKLTKNFDQQRVAFIKAEDTLAKTRKHHAMTAEKNQELKKQIHESKRDSNLLKNEIGSLWKASSHLQARIHRANVSIASEKDRIVSLESKLRSTRGKMRISTDELESLKKQTEHTQQEIDELKEAIKRIHTLLDKTEDKSFHQIQKQMLSLQEDLNSSKAAVSHRMTMTKTEWSKDLFQMQQLTTAITNLKFNIESLHRDLLSAEAKYAEVLAFKSQMKEMVETNEHTLAEKKTYLKDAQLLVEDQKQVVRSLDNEIRHLQGTFCNNMRKLVVFHQKDKKLKNTIAHSTEAVSVLGKQPCTNRKLPTTTPFPEIKRRSADEKTGNNEQLKYNNNEDAEGNSTFEKLRETREQLRTYAKHENVLYARIRNQRQQNHTLTMTLKRVTERPVHQSKAVKYELQIREASDALETAIWDTYQEYKKELHKTECSGQL